MSPKHTPQCDVLDSGSTVPVPLTLSLVFTPPTSLEEIKGLRPRPTSPSGGWETLRAAPEAQSGTVCSQDTPLEVFIRYQPSGAEDAASPQGSPSVHTDRDLH